MLRSCSFLRRLQQVTVLHAKNRGVIHPVSPGKVVRLPNALNALQNFCDQHANSSKTYAGRECLWRESTGKHKAQLSCDLHAIHVFAYVETPFKSEMLPIVATSLCGLVGFAVLWYLTGGA